MTYYTMISVLSPDDLIEHYGHRLEIVNYGAGRNYSLECRICDTVLADCYYQEPSK